MVYGDDDHYRINNQEAEMGFSCVFDLITSHRKVEVAYCIFELEGADSDLW